MNYRRLYIQAIIAIIVLLIALGTFIAIVDPYQQYHARTDKYSGEQRYEISGIARNHDYDAILTGSSMSMNHYPAQVDSLFEWNTKNFSIMGATYDDYGIILPYIISKGKVKNIIINIDVFSFARERGAVPKYLYDDNVWNDYEYLYNYSSLKNAVRYLRNPIKGKDLYHFNSPVGKIYLIEDFKRLKLKDSYEGEIYNFDMMKERFDSSILKNIQDSSTRIIWYVYLPPYSIAEFILLKQYGDLDTFLKFQEYMICQLNKFKNVKLFDFQRESWIGNLNEYMDVRHHSHTFNREIIRSISIDSCRVKDLSSKKSEIINKMIEIYRDSL